MATKYDFIILSSGSTAFAAALTAQELGIETVMIENRTVGGTCVNRGCLPSKNLIEAAKLVFDARNPRYPGLTPCEIEVSFRDLIAQKDDLVHDYRKKKYESLVGNRFGIERGSVRFLDPHTVEVGEKHLTGDKLLIATGSRPVIPKIPGLHEVSYLTSDLLTSDEAAELTECPKSLLILGGGYIALELGQMFSRFGCRVTILERSGQLLALGYEPQVGQTIEKFLTEEGIQIVTNATVRTMRRESDESVATVLVGGSQREYRAEKLLVAAGRRPNIDNIDLEKAGLSPNERGEVEVDYYLQTAVPHIFAGGDVIGSQHGSQMATPVGARQGNIAAHNALSGREMRALDHRVVPRAIFIDPPVGIVGLTEAEAIAAGHRCWCKTLPMSLVPRAGAIRDTRGIINMVADATTNEVLGVSMVGPSASEVIHEAAMAMRFRAKVQDFIDLLHVYPTMAEAVKLAAVSRVKDPAKLSCCAE